MNQLMKRSVVVRIELLGYLVMLPDVINLRCLFDLIESLLCSAD